MTSQELSQAFGIAKSKEDLSAEDISMFDGFGLPGFSPVYVTLREVAALIRWLCKYISGGWDMNAFQTVAKCGLKLFKII